MKKDIPVEYVFIAIGERSHFVDGIAPMLISNLAKKYKLRCMFCNQQNIKETKDMCLELRSDKTRKFMFIALDVGFVREKCLMLRREGGLKPASAIKPEQKIWIGDVGYIFNISNIYSHVRNKTPMECLLEDYRDDKIVRKRNRRVSRFYGKLDNLFKTLQA